MKKLYSLFLICALVKTASADSFVVNGQSGPWDYVNGGLNTSYQYGVHDQLSPTLISSIGGIPLSSGQYIGLTYLTGTVNPSGGSFDANGAFSQPNYNQNNQPPNEHGTFPAYFTIPEPANYAELLGTFANNSGQIVGTPFVLGNGPSIVQVPAGATRLQLGVNDNLFGDNSGSWTINAEFTVPEPTAGAFVFVCGVITLVRRLRK